ncbi:MAG: hypothetical protein V7L11_03860 [Nostoc sp.]|uniref:helix-turn-helix domain-containing protein n=1 Tax=Nostoc sp. TaxID=1180 RepID=UPI002FF45898
MTLTFNPERYKELLSIYCSKTIQTEAENEQVLAIVEDLMHRKRTSKEHELYQLLITLIEQFEREYYQSDEQINPHSMLLFLLEQSEKTREELEAVLGSKDLIDHILNEQQNISSEQARKLGEFFHVEPSLFAEMATLPNQLQTTISNVLTMTTTESISESLTDAQWEIAHAIAQTLVKENTDVNELGKTVAYLRASIHQPDATSRFFKYLKTLVSSGRQIGHSGRTTDYYRSIDKACSDYLKGIQDAYTILQILGWVSRLMRYYKDAGPIGEIPTPTTPVVELARQAEISKVAKLRNFQVDQILDATVTNKNGIKVTYEILGTIKLTEKEPKKAASLKEGQVVKVKITALKDDGSIKSVKFTD